MSGLPAYIETSYGSFVSIGSASPEQLHDAIKALDDEIRQLQETRDQIDAFRREVKEQS
jgi:hypothetical protein